MSLLVDILLVFQRHLRISTRNPLWIVIGLSQPVAFLVLYGPLMTSTLSITGVAPERAWQTYVPGVLVQLCLFGSAFVGFGVIAEWRGGVIERLRVTPVSRVALLLGRVLRDVALLVVQAVLLVVVALPLGLRASVPGVLVALGVVTLLSLGLACLSCALALTVKSEDTLGPTLNTGLMPLLLLSGVLLPMSFAPRWLDLVSRLTPFRYIVDGMRSAFQGEVFSATVLSTVLVALSISVLSVLLGVRTYLRQSA
ncbi:ABC transporter permease [Micromonospora andamanensis]|uniref:ABC transporter permease n=1 Tax=Micromonospora andamanensis TaxID=1287068 RepID=UPI00194DF81F|nr:ABC transporter permease [Micromonospora andamanensis]GIJ38311.1 transport permease protein [Micromonospora andamanensis]